MALVREHCRERDHGLPGLIRFLSSAESAGGTLECVSAQSDARHAATLLSLHKAKGLEFPVVVLAMTGRAFNVHDTANRVLSGAEWIGVDLFDPQEYLKTPTIARRLLAWTRRRAILDEEMRLLYVAFTRARDRLIVTGTLPGKWEKMVGGLAAWRKTGAVPDPALYGVRRPLEWLLGALRRQDLLAGLAAPGDRGSPRPTLSVALHAPEAPRVEPPAAPATPPEPWRALGPLAARIGARYPHATATRWRGRYYATEIKRLVDLALRDEERETGAELAPSSGGATEGLRLHAVLERLDFTAPADAAALRAHALRIADRGGVPPEWVTETSLEPIARFLTTPLAAEMRAAAAAGELEREVPFALKLRPSELARIWPEARELPEEEWILVQGQIDAVWPRPDGARVLLDFKSDRVTGEAAIAARAESYRPQVRIYREAVARLWRAERVACRLYFLRAGRAVEIE
jgi:ATP-dependent helicase/nuclease subunit A